MTELSQSAASHSKSGIQNAVSVAIGKNRLNAEIAFYIAPKTRFGQLKNLSNAAVSSRIGHILNHCSKYTWSQELLRRKGKLVVGQSEEIRQKLIQLIHTSPFGGHSGVEVTYQKLPAWFY